MKKQIKKLNLNKVTVSDMNVMSVKGGTDAFVDLEADAALTRRCDHSFGICYPPKVSRLCC